VLFVHRKRQAILDCAIPAIIGKRDKPPCLDTHDYNFGEEMALKGIRIVQDICEAGLFSFCFPRLSDLSWVMFKKMILSGAFSLYPF
jgi:hypothetical protein